MKPYPLTFALLLLLLITMGSTGYSQEHEEAATDNASTNTTSGLDGLPLPVPTLDKIAQEDAEFASSTRLIFESRKFGELEALASKLRTSKARFGNSIWKISRFYDSQECKGSEPESMWQLHSQIHNEWIAAKPQSITARVSYAKFLVNYAWHARGNGYSDTVTETGWSLYRDRLADARKVLDDAASLQEKCPVWWHLRMSIALGQSWSREEFEKLFAEAKSVEPEFWGYDVARSWYLMPRWHGNPGDWEAAAEAEAKRPGSLGLEGYAHVVIARSNNYRSVFEQTKASWPDARKGIEILMQKYPDSLLILNQSCRLACLGQDRALAKQLFEKIGCRMHIGVWNKESKFIEYRKWAYWPNAK